MPKSILLLLMLSTLYLSQCATPDVATTTPRETDAQPQTEQFLHRIGIRSDSSGNDEFFDRLTGLQFVPRGYNYTHVRPLADPCLVTGIPYHSTFNLGLYDPVEADAMLKALQDGQYNVVRVFLSPACMLDLDGNLLPGYIANLADFLRLAKAHDQTVIITTDMIPSTRFDASLKTENDIWWRNTQYLSTEELALEKAFWVDFINTLRANQAPLDVVLAYELRNELYFHPDFQPLNQVQGTLTTANHQTYDLGLPAEKERLVMENVTYWIGQIRDVIRAVDPTALVTVGFFAPEPFGTPSRSAIFNSDLDFVDLHLYPRSDQTMENYAAYFGLDENPKKLIVMGEFGVIEKSEIALSQAVGQLKNWQTESCHYNFAGWLLWTWPTQQRAVLSIADDGKFFQVLAPGNRPDPCEP